MAPKLKGIGTVDGVALLGSFSKCKGGFAVSC